MKLFSPATDIDVDVEPREKSHPEFGNLAPDPDRRRLARLLVASAAVMAGVLLLLLAVPRLFSAIELLDARSVAERAQIDDPKLSDAQIESAALALGHALEWQDDADLAALLAATRLTQATRTDTAATATVHLTQAEDAAKQAIRLSPAHPTAWAVLAQVLEARDPRAPQFTRALQRAIAVAPYDPRYLAQRIEMACRYWHLIDVPTRRLASSEIRILARRDLRALAALAQRSYGLQPVRDALSADADLLERFDAAYMALP
jgi:hypothetical protein